MPFADASFIIQGDDGQEYGPADLAEMRDWVRENRAGLGTKVKTDEPGALWQPWQYYPELVALLAESRATGGGPLAGSVLAAIPRRMVAFLLDFVLCYLLLCPIFILIYLLCLPDVFVQLAVSFSQGQPSEPQLPTFYEALFEVIFYAGITLYMAGFHSAHGRTPAKSIFRLRVVDRHGEKPTFGKALVRGLVLSFSLGLFFFPFLYIFLNPQRRALHDLAAGTYVVEV